MREIDFSPAFEVSRTIGPANYYQIDKQLLEDDNVSVSLPPRDISRKRFTAIEGVGSLLRENSVLQIFYTFCKSQRLGDVSNGIALVTNGAFFWSDCRMSFGPMDITQSTETEDGQLDVALVDLAQFTFSLTCDNFTADPAILINRLNDVPAFRDLRERFEQIVGGLKLFVSF